MMFLLSNHLREAGLHLSRQMVPQDLLHLVPTCFVYVMQKVRLLIRFISGVRPIRGHFEELLWSRSSLRIFLPCVLQKNISQLWISFWKMDICVQEETKILLERVSMKKENFSIWFC